MNRLFLRIKICIKDITACICYLVSAVVVLCLLLGLDSVSEERSAVPIGLINDDLSSESERLRESIMNNDAFYVYEGSRELLNEKLLEGYINSIVIIKEDYGLRIRKGNTDEIVEIISGEDNKVSVVVGDIIAGSMLYDVCAEKGYRLYLKQEGNAGLSRDEYQKYILKTADRPDFQFGFGLEYRDANDGKIDETSVTNGMIYKQMIAGMFAMLLSLIAFVSCNGICLEYEAGTRRRLKNLPNSKLLMNTADFFGIYLYTLPLGLAGGYLLAGLKGMAIAAIYLLLLCAVCLLLSNLLKKTDAYQLAGAVLIIALGVCGFVSVFSGLVGGSDFLNYTPNALFIENFIK